MESETKEYYVSALDLLFARRSKHLTESLSQDYISASARKGHGLGHGVIDLLFDGKEGTGCVLLVSDN